MKPEHLKRYDRQMRLPEIGEAGQIKLSKARVLLIGAGGLGCPAALYLAAAGVGTIGIIDADIVSESNLHRQVLYGTADVDRLKIEVATERLQAINPELKLERYHRRFQQPEALELARNFDLLIDGSDNFGTRYLVNDVCLTLSKPFISASVFRFEGQLAVCNAELADGSRSASYRCIFPESPDPLERPNCEQLGVLGSVPGILGVFQAQEAIKVILGLQAESAGKLQCFDFLNNKFDTLKTKRSALAEEDSRLREQNYYDAINGCAMTEKIKDINAQEALQLLKDGAALLDVREVAERHARHLGGQHIPLGELPLRHSEISPGKKLICYCAGGVRSERALRFLEDKLPNTELFNLADGINGVSGEEEKGFLNK